MGRITHFMENHTILVVLLIASWIFGSFATNMYFTRYYSAQSPGPGPARWITEPMPPLEGLHHANPDVREAAAASLAVRGKDAIPFIPDLIVTLDDDQENVRYQAAAALESLGPVAKPAIPSLISHLRNRNEKDRTPFVRALRVMGLEARDEVPLLIAALEAHDPALSLAALKSLEAIGPAARPAIPALIAAIKEPNKKLAALAISVLGSFGAEAKAAVPDLIALAFGNPADNDEEALDVRGSAIETLGKIGPDAEPALPQLLEVLDERKKGLFYSAIFALGRIGPAAEAAVPTLTAIAVDWSPRNTARRAAASAVFRIAPFFAEELGLAYSLLDVHLEKIPDIRLKERVLLREDQKAFIRSLIAKLSEIESYDELGYAGLLVRQKFAPLSNHYYREEEKLGFEPSFRFRGESPRHKLSDAFRSLVDMGVAALPFLLESLEDDTPTKLPTTPHISYTDAFVDRGYFNPVNPFDRGWAYKQRASILGTRIGNAHTMNVGDVCLAAIEQIVGRPYSASEPELSSSVSDKDSVASRELRQKLRATWARTDSPARQFRSLLIDFHTRVISFGAGGEYSSMQIAAARRLLFYFPRESSDLVAARLQSLDVQLPESRTNWLMNYSGPNGSHHYTEAYSFIRAIAWCKTPAIQKALNDIADRTDDPEIKTLLSIQ